MATRNRSAVLSLPLIVAPLLTFSFGVVSAVTVDIAPSRDNTLFEYDPSDGDSLLHSNGIGNFFSAGRNRANSLIRRGLIAFDLSDLPSRAVVVPGSVSLQLHVVDAPKRDTSGAERPFWLVPLDANWGEGSSLADVGVSGAGSGAPAQIGDATWLHSEFNPAIHDPRHPDTSVAGHWQLPGAMGANPLDPTQFGAPAGLVPAAPYLGPVDFRHADLENDLNHWIARPDENFGWIVLGDERVDGSEVSSNRGFASREHVSLAPRLVFEYVLNPDINQDGMVDAADASSIFDQWSQSGSADLNLDGLVDAADAGIVFAAWTGDAALVPETMTATWLLSILLSAWGIYRRDAVVA